jgi:AraC family transcriptional regulator
MNARLTLDVLSSDPAREPRRWVAHQQVLALALRRGSIDVGVRRSEMRRSTYDAGGLRLLSRHLEKWVRIDDLEVLSIGISDTALTAACERTDDEVALRSDDHVVDARIGALAAAVNAERVAGFPSGRLFLDSIEQALAVALVHGYAARDKAAPTYRGGLGAARMRHVAEFIQAGLERDLTLVELAQSVGLSTAHFAVMFRQSTGETPHRFVLRCRMERAKEMLRTGQARIVDVAVACGFKTQQHFARVFRQMCGATPREYRQDFLERSLYSTRGTSHHVRRLYSAQSG